MQNNLTIQTKHAQGSNRAPASSNLLQANHDVAAIEQFLAEYQHVPATQRCYQKEIERLLCWAIEVCNKPISGLTREDFAAYADFLRNPQPYERWCGPKRGAQGKRFTEHWRPFVGALSDSAHKTAFAILNSFMSYLVQARYLQANPLVLMRNRQTMHNKGRAHSNSKRHILQRCFDHDEWGVIVDTLETDTTLPQFERTRFLVAILYFLALRISEVENHQMQHFQLVRGRWLFYVIGKGNKEAAIPVNSSMLAALQHYRTHLGLSPLPTSNDTTPLLANHSGTQALTARRLNQILKTLLAHAAKKLGNQPEKVQHIQQASAHWFRHTAITRQAEKGIHFKHIKENARHAKLETTMLYIHLDDDERHDELAKHTWR